MFLLGRCNRPNFQHFVALGVVDPAHSQRHDAEHYQNDPDELHVCPPPLQLTARGGPAGHRVHPKTVIRCSIVIPDPKRNTDIISVKCLSDQWFHSRVDKAVSGMWLAQSSGRNTCDPSLNPASRSSRSSIVVGLIGVISAIAVPMFGNALANFRLSGDARSVSNAVAVAKMRAASDFSRVRLYVDLAGQDPSRSDVRNKTTDIGSLDRRGRHDLTVTRACRSATAS